VWGGQAGTAHKEGRLIALRWALLLLLLLLLLLKRVNDGARHQGARVRFYFSRFVIILEIFNLASQPGGGGFVTSDNLSNLAYSTLGCPRTCSPHTFRTK